jgi:hypothetical protein
MAAKLLVVSDWDQRLKIETNTLEVHSAPSSGDGYTTLVLETPLPNSQARLPINVQRGKPPPPPPDVTMSFLAGLPSGVSPANLVRAKKVAGPIPLADLWQRLNAVPDGQEELLIIGSP